MSDAALIAAFLAKNKVTKVETGVRAIASDRDIYAAMREGKLAVADSVAESARTESTFWRKHDAYSEARYMGASQETALRDMDNA